MLKPVKYRKYQRPKRFNLMRTCYQWAVIALSYCASVSPSSLHYSTEIADTNDPVTSMEITYPVNSAIEKPPVNFVMSIGIRHGAVQQFKDQYDGMKLCIETIHLNGTINSTHLCSGIHDKDSFPPQNEVGDFTVRAFIAANASSDTPRYWISKEVSFSVVSEPDFDAEITRQVQEEGNRFPDFDLGILEWAAHQQQQQNLYLIQQLSQDLDVVATDTKEKVETDHELTLVVGIKTSVATNFAIRQAIRQTWASKEFLPGGVKVFFIGCRPSVRVQSTENYSGDNSELRRLGRAIELEKLVYGDLLTDELDCDDSYAERANKVAKFLHFTTAKYSHARYVMIADDDIYVRMDEVLHRLRTQSPRTNFYSGQVHAIKNAQKEKPVRDGEANYRYRLSKEMYPMNELPPFAIGAYFFLSMDCVKFIAKNRRRLHSLDGMDDMSMALWLMTIQVQAQPFGQLQHLRGGPCVDNLIVIGDLSPLSIRLVHDNLIVKHPICHGFNHHMWIKPKSLAPSPGYPYRIPDFTEMLTFEFSLQDPIIAHVLEIVTLISSQSQAGIKLSYFPSLETPQNYFRRICGFIRLHFAGAVSKLSCTEITKHAQSEIQRYSEELDAAVDIDISRLHLWKFNIREANIALPALIAAYEPGVAHVLFECLFTSVFKDQKRPLLVIPANLLHEHYKVSPDVLVFGSLSGNCNPTSTPECKKLVAEYFERYSTDIFPSSNSNFNTARNSNSEATVLKKTTQFVMWSGEAWSTDGLDERVLLISTVANVNRTKHIYLPMASASFAERLDRGPLALLTPLYLSTETLKTKFCAYLYAHCTHSNREFMYDTLNELRPVDALGKCTGSSKPPNLSKLASRMKNFYNDDAMQKYLPYKFVIAFENTQMPGYVTEKVVNAFLAGSIPVYWGDSTAVSTLFNPKSFIDCGRFKSFQDCAEYVVFVDDSPEIYSRMRQEAPVTNVTAFNEAFSWHPTVASRFMADAVLKHLDF